MAETITVSGTTKVEQYASLLPQLKALAEDNAGQTAVLGNIMAALKYGMNFFWVGLYEVQNNELVLSVFQGPVACTKIGFGKGVCGHAWKHKKTTIVQDVNAFEGHIACSSKANSEIVLPVFDKQKRVKMVLDIDSEKLACFDQADKSELSKVVTLIEEIVNK